MTRLGGRDAQLATEAPGTSYCIAGAGRLYFLGTRAGARLYLTDDSERSFRALRLFHSYTLSAYNFMSFTSQRSDMQVLPLSSLLSGPGNISSTFCECHR
jgi:hypothetical protein